MSDIHGLLGACQVTYSFVQVNTWCDSDDDLLAKASKDGGSVRSSSPSYRRPAPCGPTA